MGFLRTIAALCAAGLGVLAQDKSDMQSIALRTHSLQQPYVDNEMQSRWWDFGGNTIIRADSYIRLTSEKGSQEGWLFSRVPLTATNWEIEFEFSINGKGNLYGDGFAMWLTKQRGQVGKVFGHTDKFEGLGVFFDTYKNHRPGTSFPYVMAMVGDGTTEYDKDNDGKANELGGCSARGIRNLARPAKARLTYFHDQNLILELQYKKEDEWTQCFDIPNVKIPSVAYLGFSAETGELSDNHDIIKISTRNLYQGKSRESLRQQSLNNRRNRGKSSGGSSSSDQEGGGWFWFLLKLVLFCVLVGGGYVGYTAYRAQKRGSRF